MPLPSNLDRIDEGVSDTADAINAGILIGTPSPLDEEHDGRFFSVLVPPGAQHKTIDLDELREATADHPRRKRGTVHVQDAPSFVEYLAKHGQPCTEIYADPGKQKLVAVINDHAQATDDGTGDAGHRDHRVELELVRTKPWAAWLSKDGKQLTQQQFAEHVEDNAHDVFEPDGATMLEIAQSLYATTGSDFKSAIRLADGNVQFRYEETTTARAGEAGDLEIPLRFELLLAPFEGDDPVQVTARFRYRTRGGELSLSYALLRPEDVEYQAFLRRVEGVRDNVAYPVFLGRPE